MNTVLSRANAIFAFTLSVLAALTFMLFLSTAFQEYKGNVKMTTVRALVKNVPDYGSSRSKNDLGFVTFDLNADLTHLFNWNVKQLFVYLTAHYMTANNVVNQIVLWDKIIRRGEDAVLEYKNVNTKYYFWDDGNGLKGNKNISLTLSWNVIPNAGSLPNVLARGSYAFEFPLEYTMSKL